MFSCFVLFFFENSILRSPFSLCVQIKNLYMQQHLCNQRIACFPLHSLLRPTDDPNRFALSLFFRLHSEGCNQTKQTIVPRYHQLKFNYNCLKERKRQKEKKGRKIETYTKRQRERQTGERWTHKNSDKKTERKRDRRKERQRGRETERKRDLEKVDRLKVRQRDRETSAYPSICFSVSVSLSLLTNLFFMRQCTYFNKS